MISPEQTAGATRGCGGIREYHVKVTLDEPLATSVQCRRRLLAERKVLVGKYRMDSVDDQILEIEPQSHSVHNLETGI